MHQLLMEFNQDKVNKIVNSFVEETEQFPDAIYGSDDALYVLDKNWMKAAVMHLDHLRQDKYNLTKIITLARTIAASHTNARRLIAAQGTKAVKAIQTGQWHELSYKFFLKIINCFEPSAQMRQTQSKYEVKPVAYESQHVPQGKPVVLQNDDQYLLVRAETPKAAIEAKQLFEQITKQNYTWCISSSDNNMFMRYRIHGSVEYPVTAYFALNKTKPVDDAWHAFVMHVGKQSIMMTNADNRNPSNVPNNRLNLPGLDVSKLIVQPLSDQEMKTLSETQYRRPTVAFSLRTYDEKTKIIQRRELLRLSEYELLGKDQQHLYLHYLNPSKPDTLEQAMKNLEIVLTPIAGQGTNIGLDCMFYANESSLQRLFDNNEVYTEFFKCTWSKETKEYYYIIVKRAFENAMQLILQNYV